MLILCSDACFIYLFIYIFIVFVFNPFAVSN